MGHIGGGGGWRRVPPLYTEGSSVAWPEAWSSSSGQAPLSPTSLSSLEGALSRSTDQLA